MNVNNVFTKFFFKKKIYIKAFFEIILTLKKNFRIQRNFYELK